MGFHTTYRFSVHAAIFNDRNEVLLLKQTYSDQRWGLPGGGVEVGETVYQAILRECQEELGVTVVVQAFTGLYYHQEFNAQVGIFRCALPPNQEIMLSEEHSEYRYLPIDELGSVQKIRVSNALAKDGHISAAVF